MKNLFLLLLAGLFTFQVSAQTIRRVSNDLIQSDPSVFTNLQAAIDASSNGDIIYIEPTGIGNTGATVNKKLTIIGPGYKQQLNQNTSYDKRQVYVSDIAFEYGSSGSVVKGLQLGYVDIKDINITVTRCFTNSIAFSASDMKDYYNNPKSYGYNAIISGNLTGNIWGNNDILGYGTVITNNIIYANVNGLKNPLISYNTFSSITRTANNGGSGGTIHSNIFVSFWPPFPYNGSLEELNNIMYNNICTWPGGLPSENNNINNVNLATLFKVADPLFNYDIYSSNDANFQLADDSPAQTAGVDGGSIGAFAGSNPFIISGLPEIPTITKYHNSGVGTTNKPITIHVDVRANN